MEVGRLTKLMTIQANTVTRDGGGQTTNTPTTVTTRWASVTPTSGTETEEGDKIAGQQGYKVTMRYYSGLDTEHSMTFVDNAGATRTLEIESIQNLDERGETQVCTCRENV
jgi:head-tail adaptor